MSEVVARLLRWIHRLEDGLLVTFLLTMIVLAFTQIVLRNGFDTGFSWADSLLRVMVLWIALLGAMVATRERQHINIDIISRFLPAYAQRIAQVSTAIFASLVCAILAKYTYNFVQMEFQAPSMAFAQVPTWLCESIMPISFSIMSLRYCLFALQDAIAYQGNAA
ncbi:MAG: TRAP transporter small permease subunit [Moraxellaceae bacterium]|nr:TRAP transporter small permease subunit [Pseudomonadales bacterium]MCB1673267.1 TRAP transporter small permease subunit [Pseudomonadales bacterium]MCP5175292.1 TRAP transporter small permease subunit [Moraxellaceae bacterium]MCP5177007.1 TRAP transporter small permease subunit [Moraxellaceae bacterium]HQV21924.1 TRAP transporter small permease [Agitococcus sp.]